MSQESLIDLAKAVGLQPDWTDAAGRPHAVTPETLRVVLAAMDVPCAGEAEIADSRRRVQAELARATAAFVTATVGGRIDLPAPKASARLVLESGETRDITLTPSAAGARFTAPEAPGYYRLELGDRRITLAVAPRRCFSIGDLGSDRLWGVAAQVYALRGARPAPFGDFAALREFAEAAGRRGADALAISPVHALFAADPSRYSPYAPSTRLHLNGLYADPSLLPGEGEAMSDDGAALIDWAAAIPAKRALLRRAFDRFMGQDAGRADFEQFRRDGGPDLELHARYEALHAHFLAAGARGWQDWPAAFHDPAGAPVAAFAQEHGQEVAFHLFLQWLADQSLGAAQDAARASGMKIGLIKDLAVGMDAGGSQAWSRPQDILNGLSVGAPPDLIQTHGQDWGIAAFSPLALRRTGFDAFIATVRSAMRHAGGVRIDHAMGLRRLWLTPSGAKASQGCYLTYPLTDMLRLIALESVRARAVVVGEDLGTVPEGFREAMDEAAILGMRVLWFERDQAGGFTPPGLWDQAALALTTTHDLPTIAGWWAGRDLDWKLTLDPGEPVDGDREGRSADRARLWDACLAAGVAAGDPPPPEAAAPVVDAAIQLVAKTPCALAIVPVEDLLGLVEQPNLPGTTTEHPNWRRRLAGTAEALLSDPAVSARLRLIDAERR